MWLAFIFTLWSEIELGLPARCLLRGRCPFASAFPPEDDVNPCLAQKVHILDFLQFRVEHLVYLFCL